MKFLYNLLSPSVNRWIVIINLVVAAMILFGWTFFTALGNTNLLLPLKAWVGIIVLISAWWIYDPNIRLG